MASMSLLTAALALGTAVSASPVAARNKAPSKRFSVNQVRNEKFTGNSGPIALAKAYNKFHAPLPAGLQETVDSILAEFGISARDTGSATTKPTANDEQYVTPVSIGTPAQVLHLDFDTGSSDLWVFSSETPSDEINGQSVYNPDDSSSAQYLDGESWEISYEDRSSSSGDVYTDTVTVGGLTVTGQAVEVASTVSAQFSYDKNSDGLLGLGFSSINTVQPDQQLTFFDNAAQSLDSALFTADLKHGKPGKYNFGYIDSDSYTGDISYTDVDSSQGVWEFTPGGYKIGSGSKKAVTSNAIADTGTTLLLIPEADVKKYYAEVSGSYYNSSQAAYLFPCESSLPTFTYYVEDLGITVPSEFINYGQVTEEICYGGIQADTGIGFSIYGDVALKAAFVVFDATPKLGFC